MAAGPTEAAGLIHTVLSVTALPRPTRDVLIEIIESQGWFSGSFAEDKADTWLRRFTQRLRYIFAENVEEGRYLSFCFNSTGTDYVQGYCYSEPSDTADVVQSKQNRANTIEIYEHCQGIKDRDFELLSGKILDLLKVEKSVVSQRSSDQGVDFFGRMHLGEMLKSGFLHIGAEKNLYVWLVGQAKHYPDSRVSTNEIRELVGSVELAKSKVFAGRQDPLEELHARFCDPVIYLFFTTGRFTRDSKELMARAGIISFTGLQIAQFLADRGVGLTGGLFDSVSFNRWVGI